MSQKKALLEYAENHFKKVLAGRSSAARQARDVEPWVKLRRSIQTIFRAQITTEYEFFWKTLLRILTYT